MLEHIRVLGILGIGRALIAAFLGVVFLWKAQSLTLADYRKNHFELDAPIYNQNDESVLAYDETAFRIAGGVCFALGAARLLQGIGVLFWRRWAKSVGLGLACFDIVNLALFPLSTALGLYGLVVYRSQETAERFHTRATASGLG